MVEQIVVIYAAPIPVGHHVEVRWYKKTGKGILGGKKTEIREYQPVIRDMDTDVEYCTDFEFGASGVLYPHTPLSITSGPGPDFELERLLTGKVTFCRVITVLGFGNELHLQTHLAIEPS